MYINFSTIKKIPFITTTFIIVVVCIVYFSIKITYKSSYHKKTNIESSFIGSEINIFRNFYGLPHIQANSEKDAAFALGYIHAQDRLWQMDYFRRIALGKQAEILGPEYIRADQIMRALNLKESAFNSLNLLDNETKKILLAYTNGVNQYIIENQNNLSYEFGALEYFPANTNPYNLIKWSPIDCLLIWKYFSLKNSVSFGNKIVFADLEKRLGTELAASLFPDYKNYSIAISDSNKADLKLTVPIIDSTSIYKDSSRLEKEEIIGANIYQRKNSINNNNEIYNLFSKLNYTPNSVGSNAWLIGNKKMKNKSSIIAADLHYQLSMPNLFYPYHQNTQNSNLIGLSLPGVPFCLIGRNNYVAWAYTNSMYDDFELAKIELDHNKDYYKTIDNKIEKVTYIVDSIKIKGKASLVYYQRKVGSKIIISDYFSYLPSNQIYNQDFNNSQLFIYDWKGNRASKEFDILRKLNNSKSNNEISDNLKQWSSPALNFLYTDKNFNLNFLSVGKINNKEKHSLLVQKWEDFNKITSSDFDLQSKFSISNPSKNYIISSNNKFEKNDLSDKYAFWYISQRAIRIDEMLNEGENYSYKDCQIIQNDLVSMYSKEILNYLIPVLDKYYNLMNAKEKNSYNKLKYWDKIFSRFSETATFYKIFYSKFQSNIFANKIGDYQLNIYAKNESMIAQKILDIMNHPSSNWFDNPKTDYQEKRDYILVKSFKQAVSEFEFGKNAKYGKKYLFKIDHPMHEYNMLDYSTSAGKFEAKGDFSTISTFSTNGESKFDFANNVGPVARFIADISDSVVYISMPGGISGDLMSANYNDQSQLWYNGGYMKYNFKSKPDKEWKLALKISRK